MTHARETVTRLLADLAAAPEPARTEALETLLERLRPELRRLAARMMRRERAGHTLQPTVLVHEAFLELVDQAGVDWQGRAHFMAAAARVMRQVLVDHARRRGAAKRGGGARRVTLDEHLDANAPDHTLDVLALSQALDGLAAIDPRGAQVVELRVFGGVTAEETARLLGVSKRTVDSDWSVARLWLARALRPAAHAAGERPRT
jgi:RNA polymerase sigma-70 factor, ECF subfamily